MSLILSLLAASSTTVAEAPVQSGVTVYRPPFFAASQPSTALDMIGRIPGFSYEGGDSARGYAGTASNVLIDGVRPASKSDSTDSILSRIPASDVDRIELIRGGAPGIDMQGRTVMANVIRKQNSASTLTVSAGDNIFSDGHSIPNGSILYSGRFGGRTLDLGLSRYASLDDSVGDGRITTIPRTGPTTSRNARTAGHGGGLGLTGAYSGKDLDGDLRLNFKLQETYFNNGLSYGLPPTLVINGHDRSTDGEIGANYERKIGAWGIEATALQKLSRESARQTSVAPGDAARFSQNTRAGESILRGALSYQAAPNLTLKAGAEGAYNFLASNQSFVDNGRPIDLPSSKVEVNEKRGEAFFRADWRVTPKLRLEAGARFEYSTITESGDAQNARSFFYAKPRALLTWDPTKSTEVRLRVERKLGQLDFSNFVSSVDLKATQVNAGNPELRPDDHWQFEAALEKRFWGKGSIVITALHEQISDVSDYVPLAGSSPPIDGPGNIGSGTSDQLDIEGSIPLDRFGLPGARFKPSTVWRISSVTDPVTHRDRRISGQRPDNIQFVYEQDVPRWNSTFSFVYYKGWRETYYRLGEVDRFHLGNQFVEAEWDYKPSSSLTLVIQAQNIVPFKFYRHRTIWETVRGASPVAFDDYRAIQSQPRLYFKVRKTFQ